MRLIDEWKWEASEQALSECIKGNDTEKNRSMIYEQFHLFIYYTNVNGRQDILDKIKNTIMLVNIKQNYPIKKKNKNLVKGAKSLCGSIKKK